MTRFLAWLLGLEFLVVGAAPVIFVTIESRLFAGIAAGTIFVALGVFIVVVGAQVPPFRRMPTFWVGCVHLFGSALPLMITRIMNLTAGFEDVRVLGLPGPIFHKVSTGIFFVLMLATTFDLVRSWRRGRSERRSQNANGLSDS